MVGFRDIEKLRKDFTSKEHIRLEVNVGTDMDYWVVEFGMEGWAATIYQIHRDMTNFSLEETVRIAINQFRQLEGLGIQ